MRPARTLRYPEHVVSEVFVLILGGGFVLGQQRCVLRLEGVRDVLEEYQSEGHMLVIGWLHVAAQFVCRFEHLSFEAEIPAIAVFCCFIAIGHIDSSFFIL